MRLALGGERLREAGEPELRWVSDRDSLARRHLAELGIGPGTELHILEWALLGFPCH